MADPLLGEIARLNRPAELQCDDLSSLKQSLEVLGSSDSNTRRELENIRFNTGWTFFSQVILLGLILWRVW